MNRELNEIMEFGRVIDVLPDGSIIDRHDVTAPSLFEGELDDKSWTLLDGYSGQDRYPGPVMHNSEAIGGHMERDILSVQGTYVALICFWPEEHDDDDNIEGWAVAFKVPDTVTQVWPNPAKDPAPPHRKPRGFYLERYTDGTWTGPFADIPALARHFELDDYPDFGHVVEWDGRIAGGVPSLNPDDLTTNP